VLAYVDVDGVRVLAHAQSAEALTPGTPVELCVATIGADQDGPLLSYAVATGVAQICEAYWQLTEQAGVLQVPGAHVALTHVTGGGIFGVDNGACSVHILSNR
jgi:hypothetical protein